MPKGAAPEFTAAALAAQLQTLLGSALPCCIALSGGLDSTVLLHALASLPAWRKRLRAVHVHHGLHHEADDWVHHCRRLCRDLGVGLVVRRVAVTLAAGVSVEAEARRARYQALKRCVRKDEVLLTAHHGTDNVETMLLMLVRGAGVAGLGGIAALSERDGMSLVRPLLPWSRRQLLGYAERHALTWVDDPSNLDLRLERNYLRHKLLPAFCERWPDLEQRAAHGAALLREAAQLNAQLAAADLAWCGDGEQLALDALGRLPLVRQRNLVRYWLQLHSLSPPDRNSLHRIVSELPRARIDAQPWLRWPGGEVRRFGNRLFALQPGALSPATRTWDWARSSQCELGPGLGRLRLDRSAHGKLALGRLDRPITVRYRQGGERMRPEPGSAHRDLKDLLRESGVLPWMRGAIPLLYCGDILVAVGDLWVDAAFHATRRHQKRANVKWLGRPTII
ncbi:MAG: tRNA lysidine(34) synthetase TilS [Steroidobacteraceae bacterium]